MSLNQPLPKPADLWNTKFGFLWYNDEEIFHDSQADLDRKAAQLADLGINHIITFSCTHFRWSFWRHWPFLNEALAKVVRACHGRGIYLTEHHSSNVTFNPLNAEEERYAERTLKGCKSDIRSWPGFLEDCKADSVINGARLSELRQIDGRTGKWARSEYHGWALCYNNPDYRRAYFKYLETIYAVGVDGIMTDDVQWWGDNNACACVHCRRLFKEQTGMELPPAGDAWKAWHGNQEDEVFRAWQAFKLRSNLDFHKAVSDHYRSLGLRLLRPNYRSSPLGFNRGGYIWETVPDLDWVFQECCTACVIRYCWPYFAIHTPMLRALGRSRNIPALNLYYPYRPDTERFCWALSMTLGVGYFATSEGGNAYVEEKKLRAFEARHERLLRQPDSIARVAFYDSRRTRDLAFEKDRTRNWSGTDGLQAWIRACLFRNLPFDLVMEEDWQRLAQYRVVVLQEATLLSRAEIAALVEFAKQGGAVVWSQMAGTHDETGRRRPPAELAQCWNLDAWPGLGAGEKPGTFPVGQGRLVVLPANYGFGNMEKKYADSVVATRPARVRYVPITKEDQRRQGDVVGLLTSLLPNGPDMRVEGLPEGMLATCYMSADRQSLVAHILNSAGTLAVTSPDGLVGHDDRIPFPDHAAEPDIRLIIRKPEGVDAAVRKALAYTLDEDEPAKLLCRDNGATVEIQVPARLARHYALIEAPLDRI